MENINNTLFAHWNTDSNGNPISVKCDEQQKVSPIHLCIQLNQIPDNVQEFSVSINGERLSEVFDSENIGHNNYKVDYNDGIVWFSASRAGQTVNVTYYGRGFKTISAKRVMINNGDYIETNTLQHLVDLNKNAVDSVNNMQSNFDSIVDEANQAKNQVNEIVSNTNAYVEVQKNNIENYMDANKKHIENYIREQKNNIEEKFDTTFEEFNSLVAEIEGRKEQFNREFADAQLEKMEQFNQSQIDKQEIFENTQESKQSLFESSENRRDTTFLEAMSNYETEFEQLKNQIYDENAIANLQQQINEGYDDVDVTGNYLELIYDENEPDKVIGAIGGSKIVFYSRYTDESGQDIKEKMKEVVVSGRQSIHIGRDEPVDVDQLWVDLDDNIETMEFPEEHTFQEIRSTVQRIYDKVNNIEKNTRIDDIYAGNFQSVESTSEDVKEATVKHVRIKIGIQPNLRQLQEGELAYCTDTGNLYIGARLNPLQAKVSNVLIGGNSSGEGGSSSSNVTAQYIELLDDKQKKYRVMMGEDGQVKVRESSYYIAPTPKPSDAPNFVGLIINRYYGGGLKNNGQSPVSHGFIELYNNNSSKVTMNLNGLSIYYKTIADPIWRQLKLKGYLPYQHSYLIRCAQHNNPDNSTCRLHIDKFDQDWSEQVLSDESCMIYLAVGTDALSIANPFKLPTTGKKMEGYIDLMACSSENIETTLTAFEDENATTTKFKGYYRRYLNNDTGIQRIDFQDTDISYNDYEPVNYRTCDVSIYRPKHFDDGAWGVYYNKLKLNESIPNMVNIQFGKTWSTRTFTWETKIVDEGYLRYRKVGQAKWKYLDSEREIVYHPDQDCTIHRLVVKNLESGTYEYQVGLEGMWSDLANFEVKEYTGSQSEHIKFLQISDQQGWYESEYQAWRWASKFIENNESEEDWDFSLNTGDISQNGLRPFEWRYYYKYTNINKEKPHMLVCGNNDLAENKIYSYGFKYYDTQEEEADVNANIQGNKPYASCHSHDLGFVHFVVMNSNTAEDSDLMVKQFCWIKQDVEQARAREIPPRWFVLIAHHGALTVCRMKGVQQMIPFVEDIGFDVVICGHHHTYSRSKPIKMNIRSQVEEIIGGDLYRNATGDGSKINNAVYSIGYLEAFRDKNNNPAPPKGCTADQTTQEGANGNIASETNYVNYKNGTYWIMCQATGFKLKSNKDLEKNPIPWWYGWQGAHPYLPTYITWDFGYNEIHIVAKGINGIVQQDQVSKDMINNPNCSMATMSETIIDEITIKHKSLR